MNTRKEDILDQMPPDFRLPEVEISKTCQRMAQLHQLEESQKQQSLLAMKLQFISVKFDCVSKI